MKYRIVNVEQFKREVYYAIWFLEKYPELITTGINLQYDFHNNCYTIIDNERRVSSTVIISLNDMKHFELIPSITPE